ncbi:MAG: pyridoxal-phosphate dependent enzyme, partial [Candidatus Methylomirabilia bacterium]
TVIGLEAKKQFELAGEGPDILVGCVGGGSSFAGFTLPFVADTVTGRTKDLRFIAVEPMACPSLTRGLYVYDFGDTAKMTPLVKMYTLGHSFIPPPIHAGGLRYHGMAPLVCALYDQDVIECVAVHQVPTFEAAVTFAKAEGIVPAPEPSHAIRAVIDEALKCKATGRKKVIAFVLCGHGHFDLSAYEKFLAGKLENFEYPAEKVKEALAALPHVAA